MMAGQDEKQYPFYVMIKSTDTSLIRWKSVMFKVKLQLRESSLYPARRDKLHQLSSVFWSRLFQFQTEKEHCRFDRNSTPEQQLNCTLENNSRTIKEILYFFRFHILIWQAAQIMTKTLWFALVVMQETFTFKWIPFSYGEVKMLQLKRKRGDSLKAQGQIRGC